MTRVTIPQLDANLVDVTITAWRKQAGEQVSGGEVLAELTTDKATFDLESPADGTLLEILADVKSVVPTGYVVALVGQPGEADVQAAADNAALLDSYQTRPQEAKPAEPRPDAAVPSRVRATPKARRLAAAHGLDLADIQARTGAEVVTEAVLAPFLPGGAG